MSVGGASQFRVPRQRQRQTAVVDSSRSGEAHEPLIGERGDLACHVFLVVPVWWERHRGTGDLRSAAGETSNRVCGCEIRCVGDKSDFEECSVEGSELADCVRRYTARTAALCQTTATAARRRGWREKLAPGRESPCATQR
jgi:hypothetical protein